MFQADILNLETPKSFPWTEFRGFKILHLYSHKHGVLAPLGTLSPMGMAEFSCHVIEFAKVSEHFLPPHFRAGEAVGLALGFGISCVSKEVRRLVL